MVWAIWITGLPSSGKSWLAGGLVKQLGCEWLRLDLFRKEIVPKPTYSEEERKFVYTELAKRAAKLVEEGKNVVVDATDNLGSGRRKARQLIKNFGVVQLRCSPETAANIEKKHRDSRLKGFENLYERAKRGEIELPGVNAPYAEEKGALVVIESRGEGRLEDWVKKVLDAMAGCKFI